MVHPEVHHFFHAPIADHSFSADRKFLAVVRDTTIELYQRTSPSKFELKDELKGHDKTITGVDIAPRSGKIVTCSQDRNAYVWDPPTSPNSPWMPTLVILRINRAATTVRWSPSETKFAVGSGARVVSICYFEGENNWYISKHLKKPIRSTVSCVDWHPNGVLLAAGSTDGHARVLSSFVKGVDERPEASVWGERLPFGTVCGEYLNGTAGWVHSVAFSPSGDALAFAGHDASVTVVYPSGPDAPPKSVVSVSLTGLPCRSLIWKAESELLAAGYDCEIFRLKGDGSGWKVTGTLEGGAGKKAGALSSAAVGDEEAGESALNMFKQMDLKGTTKARDDTQLRTVHQNTINTLRAYERGGGVVTRVSSSGVDGRVVIWNV